MAIQEQKERLNIIDSETKMSIGVIVNYWTGRQERVKLDKTNLWTLYSDPKQWHSFYDFVNSRERYIDTKKGQVPYKMTYGTVKSYQIEFDERKRQLTLAIENEMIAKVKNELTENRLKAYHGVYTALVWLYWEMVNYVNDAQDKTTGRIALDIDKVTYLAGEFRKVVGTDLMGGEQGTETKGVVNEVDQRLSQLWLI